MKKPLNLLVLTQLFYPELISTGQTMTELCEELSRQGLNIKAVCGPPTLQRGMDQPKKHLSHSGIQIHRVWGTRCPKLKTWGRMLNQVTFCISAFFYLLLNDRHCPILVNTNPPFLALVCSILRKLQGRPYVYLVLDIYPDTISVAGLIRKNGPISRMWRSSNRVMFKNAAKVIVIGRHMQSILVADYAGHVADKISMIPIWSDDRLLSTDPVKPNPLAKKWELGGKFVVLYAGNMGRFHDMETVIEAAKLLQDQEDILFLFVGEGYKKASMQESVKIWGLKNCRFFTYVHRSELRNLYDCADIGLVTLQKGQEGLSVPSKTFGYMAAGLPVVAVISEKSEIALVIQEFECGQVIPPGDKGELANSILQLSQDRVRISSWGQNAKAATIKKFNLAAAANAFHRVFENLECACDKQEKVNNK